VSPHGLRIPHRRIRTLAPPLASLPRPRVSSTRRSWAVAVLLHNNSGGGYNPL
jgi:hypothetical protein